MPALEYSETFYDRAVHLTGVKGTGIAAIAEVLVGEGARVTGSDVAETFYTDELLARIGVVPRVGFSAEHIPADASLLVYSAAYDRDNPERREAERRGIPQLSYAEMLGSLSRSRLSLGVSGVHGKTTTTAMLGTMVANSGLPVTVIVGSAVPSFGGSATLRQGDEVLIAETCEYRRHFLLFSPVVAIITSVEPDHQDYYRDRADIVGAFEEYAMHVASGGAVVYCADDRGAQEIASRVRSRRPDLAVVPYGFSADGAWRCQYLGTGDRSQTFTTKETGALQWTLAIPGRHMVVNATGALAALTELLARFGTPRGDLPFERWRSQLKLFRGTQRRSETVAEEGGVTILDDYAHHPTAIRTTLEGYREFYPGRRMIVDFMSHTYSRTAALLTEFGPALLPAEIVVLNEIYASARENNRDGITGENLFDAVAAVHDRVIFEPDFEAAAELIAGELREGDLFITMGAGDNFRIGRRVAELLRERTTGGVDA